MILNRILNHFWGFLFQTSDSDERESPILEADEEIEDEVISSLDVKKSVRKSVLKPTDLVVLEFGPPAQKGLWI